MQKWTTSKNNSSSSIGVNKVSLSKILSVRPHLNEIECWALLGQTTHALQDVLLKANGHHFQNNGGKKINEHCPLIYPQRLLTTTTGRVIIDQTHFEAKSEYIHPLLAKNELYKETFSEKELEKLGVYSLAKTIQACQCLHYGGSMRDLLHKMVSEDVSLLHVMEFTLQEWTKLVGTSPISRFVAQLCKLTLGWTMNSQSSEAINTLNSVKPIPISEDQLNEISHIEFSKLNESSSSDGSSSPNLPRPPRLPISSSPILNNNNNHITEQIPKLPPRSRGTLGEVKRLAGVKRKAPQRNPSRLYRIVKPLTEVSINPGPATNRCVGPEFFVMQENHPKVLDLATNHSRKDFVSRQVDVVMLNGQRFFIHVNAASITSGEILDNVLRDQDIKESSLFTLSIIKDNEFWPLSNENKICKVAPLGWRDPKLAPNNKILHETLTLYHRVKYYPDDIDKSFKDPGNKHQLYLQLRRDVLQGRFHLSYSEYMSLAGMALQVEFGDFSHDIHEEVYFDLEHYLPVNLIKDDVQALRSSLVKLHKAHLGQGQSKTEMKFCKDLQRHDNYGFHFFTVYTDKKLTGSKLLGIHLHGIFLFDKSKDSVKAHQVKTVFYWHQITRIQYDAGKFQLLEGKNQKLKFYVEENKSKILFDLSSAHHQHSNQLRLNAKMANELQLKEPQRPMRSLKSRFLPKRQNSQHKLYTTRQELLKTSEKNPSNLRGSLRRSTTVAPSKMTARTETNYIVKRLAHYSSMADALVGTTKNSSNERSQTKTNTKDSDLNVSDKENKTPDRNYRYKVYLEPEEDLSQRKETRVPLQERPILAEISTRPILAERMSSMTPGFPKSQKRVSTNPTARRKSEQLPSIWPATPLVGTSKMSKARRISHGLPSTHISTTNNQDNPSSVLRMGTRISLSALHRERLRLTSDLLLSQNHQMFVKNAKIKGCSLDLDYEPMEYKSILPTTEKAAIVSLDEAESVPYADPSNESLSDSLMERFENMETDETALPERQIVPVTVIKDKSGRLGLKVTGVPSGIYVDDFDEKTIQKDGNTFKKGDRIVAINGRSLENVKYENALEMMRKSDNSVQFLVSQIIDY